MFSQFYLSSARKRGKRGRQCDGVLFVERAGELPSLVRLSHIVGGAEAKASPKGRYSSSGECIGGGRPETV
jgi:hypothetical protein